jgi:hypothetical protein
MRTLKATLTIVVLVIAAGLLMVGPTALLYLSGCGGVAGSKDAPAAFAYTDNTAAQGKALTTNAAAASQAALDAQAALKGNKTASDSIHDAQTKLAATQPDVPGAKSNLVDADKALKAQITDLNKLLTFANNTISTDNTVILNLSGQADLNAQLQAEGKANGAKMEGLETANAKYALQDQDIFGKMRRWWEELKWFLLISIPILIILGVLGVRYGADKITAPVLSSIGGFLGWALTLIQAAGYYIGTFILSIFPFVGHLFDEVANDARTAIDKLEGKSTTTPGPTPTPPATPAVTVAPGTPVVVKA